MAFFLPPTFSYTTSGGLYLRQSMFISCESVVACRRRQGSKLGDASIVGVMRKMLL